MYTRMREISFPLVSLGSRRESAPDVKAVAAWIAARHGQTADLISYELDTLLAVQKPYAAEPATGGEFYDERLREVFGISETKLVQEFELKKDTLADDAVLAARTAKGCRFSMPSPLSLGIEDGYFQDEDEFEEAAVEAFFRVCREQRDLGISGHVILSEKPTDIELEGLRGRKFLWTAPADQLERLLEVSRDVVIDGSEAARLEELADSYALRNVYLRDADAASLKTALEAVDADHLFTAGYAPEAEQENYWKELAELRVKKEETE